MRWSATMMLQKPQWRLCRAAPFRLLESQKQHHVNRNTNKGALVRSCKDLVNTRKNQWSVLHRTAWMNLRTIMLKIEKYNSKNRNKMLKKKRASSEKLYVVYHFYKTQKLNAMLFKHIDIYDGIIFKSKGMLTIKFWMLVNLGHGGGGRQRWRPRKSPE